MLRAFSIFLFTLYSLAARSQLPEYLRFDNIGIEKGLSQSTVYTMLQDRQGYIWICTDDGVNRYDGYTFQTYRQKRVAGEPSEGIGLCLFEDKQGKIWLRSENAISFYDPALDRFRMVTTLKTNNANSRRSKMSDAGDYLFFTNDGRLCAMEKRSGHIIFPELQDVFGPSFADALPDGSLIISSTQTLWLYNPVKKQKRNLNIPADDQLRFALSTGNNQLWVGLNGSVSCYDMGNGKLVHKVSVSKQVLCATFDESGYLWVGSDVGLTCIDTATLKIYKYFNDPLNSQSLAGKRVRCILRDRTGILWIGTNEGGISKLSRQKKMFDGISVSTPQVPGLSGKAALSFAEDGLGNIWIGNDDGNITICEARNGHIVQSSLPTGVDESVLCLLHVGDKMYYGYAGGVSCMSVKTRKRAGIQQIIPGANIKSLRALADGSILALGSKTLYCKAPGSTLFKVLPVVSQGQMLQIFVEKDGQVWLSGSADLVRTKSDGTVLQRYATRFPRFFGGSEVYDIKQDKAGVIWLGCNGVGIVRYDAPQDSFVLALPATAMPNANIYALETDNNNGLWLSTNAGVCRYSTGTGNLSSYSYADGLLSNEGIGRASLKDSYGNLWFGNIGGCNIIHPLVVPVNILPPQPYITGFRLFDKSIILSELLNNGEGIRLHQSDNYFTIEFSAMDYNRPGANKYRFMLEGFDKTWRKMTTVNNVSYTQPGWRAIYFPPCCI
jgi:ligand-binding sensor domain-containing protein